MTPHRPSPSRRSFLKLATASAAALAAAPVVSAAEGKKELFKISLAEWS
ncbi:twin-arginine translocation signal domain-containing protein [Verrucomicrobium spinosum]|nr:twin-arginine translocation signal domain-containing protein [Verrucomicrobium spinosum]